MHIAFYLQKRPRTSTSHVPCLQWVQSAAGGRRGGRRGALTVPRAARSLVKYHGVEWWSAPSGLQSARVEA